ncbi:MAG TPA: hypothetical protein VM368_08255, partial [Flavisolibacter sp.]|nr:hypothetical protein [Flavisolibacter sp.]
VDPEQLVGLNVNDIAMVKVFRGAFFGVAFGSDGAIAIYLKRGGMASRHSRLELPSGSIIGYSKQPELFAPDYNLEHYRNFTDQRQILFRPQLLYPDTNSKGTIRFFNNDIAEKYRITITGFTSEGLPVFLDKVITSNSMN